MDQVALKEAIGTLEKTIRETHQRTVEEYGAKFEGVERSVGELKDRLEQANKSFQEASKTQELVRAMIDASRQLSLSLAANRATAQRFDFGYARSIEDKVLCRRIHDSFLNRICYDDRERAYQDVAAKLTMMRAWMSRSAAYANWRPAASRNPDVMHWWGTYRALGAEMFGDEFLTRAFDTTDSAEWVPTILATELIRFLEVRGGLIPAFRNFALPGGVYDVPIVTSAAKGHMFNERIGPPTAAYDYTSGNLYTTPPTDKRTFDARTVRTFIIASRQFIEETVVPMIDFAIDETRNAVRRSISDAMQNGLRAADATFDSDIGGFGGDGFGVENSRHLWKGFRANANTNAATFDGGATLLFTSFGNTLAAMGRYGVQPPTDLLWIFGVKGYGRLLTNISEFNTLEKIGTRATVIAGSVGTILGANLVVDEDAREDLNAVGVFNGVTTTKMAPTVVHRPSWWLGNFTGIETEPERLAGWDQDVIWARWRGDYIKIRSITEKTEAMLVNVTA